MPENSSNEPTIVTPHLVFKKLSIFRILSRMGFITGNNDWIIIKDSLLKEFWDQKNEK